MYNCFPLLQYKQKEKIDQVISVTLSELAKKDIERIRSGGLKAKLINTRSPSYLK